MKHSITDIPKKFTIDGRIVNKFLISTSTNKNYSDVNENIVIFHGGLNEFSIRCLYSRKFLNGFLHSKCKIGYTDTNWRYVYSNNLGFKKIFLSNPRLNEFSSDSYGLFLDADIDHVVWETL